MKWTYRYCWANSRPTVAPTVYGSTFLRLLRQVVEEVAVVAEEEEAVEAIPVGEGEAVALEVLEVAPATCTT